MPRGPRQKKSDNVLFQSAEWIGWALGGLEREIAETRDRLAALTAHAATLRGQKGGAAPRTRAAVATANDAGPAAPARRRSGMSAEGRKRISEMMKKRWLDAKKKNKNRL